MYNIEQVIERTKKTVPQRGTVFLILKLSKV